MQERARRLRRGVIQAAGPFASSPTHYHTHHNMLAQEGLRDTSDSILCGCWRGKPTAEPGRGRSAFSYVDLTHLIIAHPDAAEVKLRLSL